MPNPYTFVNWGVLGVTEKGAFPSQIPRSPGYKISIFQSTAWPGANLNTIIYYKPDHYQRNIKNLGYATPTQARDFFTTMINKIQRYNVLTPVKKYKVRFLKSLSHEPNWRNREGGTLVYSFWSQNYGRYRRVVIHFRPFTPPKPRKIKTFEDKVRGLNYGVYGL